MHRLAIVTLRTVEDDPPVYEIASGAAYACCIRFLPPVFLAMSINFGNIEFRKFYSDFLLLFRSHTLVNCTSLNSLLCVVFFYNRLKVICVSISAERSGAAMVTLIDLWLQTLSQNLFTRHLGPPTACPDSHCRPFWRG